MNRLEKMPAWLFWGLALLLIWSLYMLSIWAFSSVDTSSGWGGLYLFIPLILLSKINPFFYLFAYLNGEKYFQVVGSGLPTLAFTSLIFVFVIGIVIGKMKNRKQNVT